MCTFTSSVEVMDLTFSSSSSEPVTIKKVVITKSKSLDIYDALTDIKFKRDYIYDEEYVISEVISEEVTNSITFKRTNSQEQELEFSYETGKLTYVNSNILSFFEITFKGMKLVLSNTLTYALSFLKLIDGVLALDDNNDKDAQISSVLLCETAQITAFGDTLTRESSNVNFTAILKHTTDNTLLVSAADNLLKLTTATFTKYVVQLSDEGNQVVFDQAPAAAHTFALNAGSLDNVVSADEEFKNVVITEAGLIHTEFLAVAQAASLTNVIVMSGDIYISNSLNMRLATISTFK